MTLTDHDLDAYSNVSISPIPAAFGATSRDAPNRTSGATSDFLTVLVTEEIAHRQQTRLAASRQPGAAFPFSRRSTTSTSPTSRPSGSRSSDSALSPDFVTEGRFSILGGKPGRGRRISRWPSRTAPFKTASMRASSPPRN